MIRREQSCKAATDGGCGGVFKILGEVDELKTTAFNY